MSLRRAFWARLRGVPAAALLEAEFHRLLHAAPPPPVPARVEPHDPDLPRLCQEQPQTSELLLEAEQFEQEASSRLESAIVESEGLRADHEVRLRDAAERLVVEDRLVQDRRRLTRAVALVALAEGVGFSPTAAELLGLDFTRLHHTGPLAIGATVFVSGSLVAVSAWLARGALGTPAGAPATVISSRPPRPALPAPALWRFGAWTRDGVRLVAFRLTFLAWCLWIGLLRAGAMGPVDLFAEAAGAPEDLLAIWRDAKTAIAIALPMLMSLLLASLWEERRGADVAVRAVERERRTLGVVGASLAAEQARWQAEREAVIERRRARRELFDRAEVAFRDRQEAEETRFRAEALVFERAPHQILANLAEVQGAIAQADGARAWIAGLPVRLSLAAAKTSAAIASVALWPVTATLWATRVTGERARTVLVELIGHVGAVRAALYAFVRDAIAGLWAMVRDAWTAVLGAPRTSSRVHRTAAAVLKTATLGLLVVLACGCAGESYRADLVIVVDASNSGHVCEGEPCFDPQIPAVFHDFARRTGLPPRSRVNVLLAGTDLDVLPLYSATAPDSWRGSQGIQATKAAWARRVLGEVSHLPYPREGAGSAVLYAVWAAGELLQESGASERWLYVLSDLRDVRPGKDGWYMPREVPNPARVLEVLDRTCSLPRLGGVEVRACGVHSRPPPKLADGWSPEKHRRLLEVWAEVGRAAGAASFSIAQQCDLPPAPEPIHEERNAR